MGDFVRAIGEGVGGLVGGSIDALSNAFDTVVGDLQQMLPGPLFPIAVVGVVLLAFWWLFKK
jgi:type IV secretory pathway VirB2 component (pilin)